MEDNWQLQAYECELVALHFAVASFSWFMNFKWRSDIYTSVELIWVWAKGHGAP